MKRLTHWFTGSRLINPIKTKYRGVTFRSTLEADWAATLDTMNVGWRYEAQGIELESGEWYLPDFWLPGIGTWLEVKGPMVPGAEKALELADAVRCSCLGVDFATDVRPGELMADQAFTRYDICECEWPGGQLVILGLPATPGRHGKTHGHGYAQWLNPRGGELVFVPCRCGYGSWIDPVVSRSCRQCGRRGIEESDWSASGEIPFQRSRNRGRAYRDAS